MIGGDGEALLTHAFHQGASDVHLFAHPTHPLIRWRVHGHLMDPIFIKPIVMHQLVSRFKLQSNMDIAQSRLPQDGYLHWPHIGIHARVATLPTVHGEDMVIRLIPVQPMTINALGFNEPIKGVLQAVIQRENGLFLVTGPTGSGKSGTLMALAHELAQGGHRVVVSLEDPVEHVIPGIRQSSIHPPTGYTYATGIKAVLRLDPDVIIVGEIRDAPTARVAIEAAYTGHLVLATLHTQSVTTTVRRLGQLGITDLELTDGLVGVLSQRLYPMICGGCEGNGCLKCRQVGITGRYADGELLYSPLGHSLSGFPNQLNQGIVWHPLTPPAIPRRSPPPGLPASLSS